MHYYRWSFVLFAISAMLADAGPLRAQENRCDSTLHVSENEPNAYRLRGDRCEGTYLHEAIHREPLRVVSLTESFEDYDLVSGDPLVVEWIAFGSDAVHLRADQIGRSDSGYRMDAMRPRRARSFTWQSSVLSALAIRRDALGVLAWTPVTVGKTKRDVYLPVRIRQKEVPLGSKAYDLEVVPSVPLEEVFVSLAAIDGDGQPSVFLKKAEPLHYGLYPADRKIRIKLPGPDASGNYYVQIGATLVGGGYTETQLWFHHVGD